MKSRRLLLTLLMTFMASWAAVAQEPQTLVIGSGENYSSVGSGSGKGYGSPFGNTYYYSSTTQFIYTADELNGVGTIHSVAFYHNSYSFKATVKIYLFHTTATTVDPSAPVTEGTPVFSGTGITVGGSPAGWQTFPLGDNAFEYNGIDNLLVVVCRENYSNGYSGSQKWQYTTTTDNKFMVRSGDANTYGSITNASNYIASTCRPNIQIEYEPVESHCARPTSLAVTNVLARYVDVGWTENGEATTWQYCLNDDETNLHFAYTNPITIGGFLPETTYTIKVRSACEGDEWSAWSNAVTFTTEPSCYAPTQLAVTDITPYMATVSWTDSNEADTWQICLDDDESDLFTTHVTTNPFGGLNPGTTYSVKVRAKCGEDDYSAWSPSINFTTECFAISNLPWNEDFNAYAGSTSSSTPTGYPNDPLPNCWQFLNRSTVTSAYPQVFISSISGYPVAGKCLFFKSSNTTPLYAILPDFEEEISGLQLNFTYRNEGTSTSNGTLIVGYMTDPTDATTFTNVLACNRTATLTDMEVLFTNAPVGSYIAFKYQGGSSNNYYMGIDNVTVDYAPSCLKPTGLTVSNVTAHEATIAWTSDASAWQVQLGDNTPIDVNEATYTFTGLTSETYYTAKVRANCGNDDYSVWTGSVNFTTTIACPVPTGLAATLTPGNGSIATLSWASDANAWVVAYKTADEEDFTEVNVDENPYNMSGLTPEAAYSVKVKAVCGGEDGESEWSNTINFIPTDALLLTVNDGTATNEYVPFYGYYADAIQQNQMIYPATELTALVGQSITEMKFYISSVDGNQDIGNWIVSLGETTATTLNGLDETTPLTEVYSGAMVFNSDETEMTVTFEEGYTYNGGNLLVEFNHPVAASYKHYYFYGETVMGASYCYGSQWDFLAKTTFAFEAPSSCHKPTNLAVYYNGGTEAIVSWTSDATSWNLRVNGTEIDGIITNPYTLTDLELATIYRVEVQANCGEELSGWAGPVSFITDLCLPEDMCEINYSFTDQYDDSWNGATIDVEDVATHQVLYTLTMPSVAGSYTGSFAVCDGRAIQFVWNSGGFDSECSYAFFDSYGEGIFSGSGVMSEPFVHTVNCYPCLKPADVDVSGITAFTATLGWDGSNDSFQVQYRTAETAPGGFIEGFESGLDRWTTIDADGDGYNWQLASDGYETSFVTHGGSDMICSQSINNDGSGWVALTPDNYIVSPQVELGQALSFWAQAQDIGYPAEHFGVAVSTAGNTDASDFTTVAEWTMVANHDAKVVGTWGYYTVDLSAYAGQTGYVAIRHFGSTNQYFLNIDDVIYGEVTPAGEWMTVTTENLAVELTGLAANTTYEYQVRGYCADEDTWTDWTSMGTFTTLSPVIFTKDIDAYTENGGWYLIASPVGNVAPTDVDNMTGNSFDLYAFDQTQELEWINYKSGSFNMEPGKGYLYANASDVTLTFAGTPVSDSIYVVSLVKDNDAALSGWNLVGNPFGETAYINRNFYAMNEAGTEIMTNASAGAIAPMQGVFVIADENDELLTFSTIEPAKSANLALNLSQNSDVVDRAIVNFDGERSLPKFQLFENSTKVYIPMNGKDYAVVNAAEMGEMPVSFKAEKNGRYTLSFTQEEVSFSYLHLIDYMTGDDVDLLKAPSYSFDACTTDYASRFCLVFATGASTGSDAFGFVNAMGNLCVFGIEGEATLQVVDVTGRVLSSNQFSGSYEQKLNVAPGVYMLRLINGNDVKIQKMVVR